MEAKERGPESHDLSLFGKSGAGNYSPGYMEQAPSRGHGASPQIGLGVGCELCCSSKKLRGLIIRSRARRIITFSLVLCFGGSAPELNGEGR